MRSIRIGIAALVLCGAMGSLPALAQQDHDYWYVAGYSGLADYIDAASIVSDGDVKRGWAWFFESSNAPPPWAGSNTRTLEEVNCRTHESRELQLTIYDSQGAIMASDSETGAWSYAIPGTVGDAEVEFICSDAATRASKGVRLFQIITPELHAREMFRLPKDESHRGTPKPFDNWPDDISLGGFDPSAAKPDPDALP